MVKYVVAIEDGVSFVFADVKGDKVLIYSPEDKSGHDRELVTISNDPQAFDETTPMIVAAKLANNWDEKEWSDAFGGPCKNNDEFEMRHVVLVNEPFMSCLCGAICGRRVDG